MHIIYLFIFLKGTYSNRVDSKAKKTTTKTFLDPEGQFLRIWRMIFVVSCMMAVSVDPLFFYLPVINEKNKCFVLDDRLRVVAICLRTATDLIYVMNIVLQFLCPYVDEAARKLGRIKVVTDSWPIAKRYFLSRYFPIDILAILPLPQVLIPIIFSEIRGSESLHKRKLLNAVLLYQYVPRLIRISMFIRTANKHSRVVRVKAALNFFLYIMASHVLGAFWYFFSIERETICWHSACEKNDTACTPNSFSCLDHVHSSGNYTFMNDYCPVETKDGTMPFDFGIYHDAIKSGIVASRNFPKKILYCSWWGLRNLSSFGQNLQTSTNFWENGFAIFISIFGLLLFLYFIGNVQTYMQLTTERTEESIHGLSKVLEVSISEDSPAPSKEEEEKVHSAILLSLSDGVLREVADEETATGLWGRSNDRGSDKNKGKSRGSSQTTFSKKNVKCHYCHKFGHYKNECPKLKNREDGTSSSNAVSVADDRSNDLDLVLAISDSNSRFSDKWVMDSACTFHMCPKKDWFINYESVNGGSVLLGNDMACRIAGIGSVRIKMFDGIGSTVTGAAAVSVSDDPDSDVT
ncbi:hypothetical protein F2P56_031363, partial [Juglans regia]